MQTVHSLNYLEAKTIITELADKYPQYSVLANNNLFYVQL